MTDPIYLRRRIGVGMAAAVLVSAPIVWAACSSEDEEATPPPATGTADPAPADPATTTAPGDGAPTTEPPEDEAPTDDTSTTAPTPEEETTSEPEPEPEAGARPATVTIGAAGDILPHARVNENAAANAGGDGYDYSPVFEPVADLLSEPDLSFCHLETPLSVDNTNLTVPRTLVFNTPREMGEALAGAGFDGCDFASNHVFDRGVDGIAETVEVLADNGLEYAGPTASAEGAGEPTVFEVPGQNGEDGDDVVVAQLAYSYTLLNSGSPNTDVPDGAPWLADYLYPVIRVEGILDDAAKAREDGADFVVLYLHWGTEYQTEVTPEQREMAQELLESDDVDLILGSHVHVIQPCETIDGKYVLYGLGNFLSNQSPDTDAGLRTETQDGMVAQITLERDDEGELSTQVRYQPTRVDLDGHVIRPVEPGSGSYQRTVDTLNSLGEGTCGAEPME